MGGSHQNSSNSSSSNNHRSRRRGRHGPDSSSAGRSNAAYSNTNATYHSDNINTVTQTGNNSNNGHQPIRHRFSSTSGTNQRYRLRTQNQNRNNHPENLNTDLPPKYEEIISDSDCNLPDYQTPSISDSIIVEKNEGVQKITPMRFLPSPVEGQLREDKNFSKKLEKGRRRSSF